MNSISDPSTWHPTWCDLSVCSHPDSLAARGLSEADIPAYRRHVHYGTARVIDSPGNESRLTLQPWRAVDQPPAETVDAIDVTVEHTVLHAEVSVGIDVADLAALTLAVDQVRLVVGTAATTPRLVDRAVAALRDFGAQYIDDAVTLLAHWRHADDMSDEEFGEAIGAFPARPPLPPREIPWPAELDPQRRQDGDR